MFIQKKVLVGSLLLVGFTMQPAMAIDLSKIISKKIEQSIENVIDEAISSVLPQVTKDANEDDGQDVNLTEGVTIFGYNGCPYCRKAYAFLEQNDIPYELMDTEKDAKANRLAQKNGIKGVPVIYVNGDKLSGYTDSSYNKLFKKHDLM